MFEQGRSRYRRPAGAGLCLVARHGDYVTAGDQDEGRHYIFDFVNDLVTAGDQDESRHRIFDFFSDFVLV
jgi:hypothetical protein